MSHDNEADECFTEPAVVDMEPEVEGFPPNLMLNVAQEEVISKIPMLYSALKSTKKVLQTGKLRNAANWVGGVEMQIRDEAVCNQIAAVIGHSNAETLRDKISVFCQEVRMYIETHFDAGQATRVQQQYSALKMPSRVEMLNEMFQRYDTDKDGYLDADGYREFLKGINVWGTGQYNDDDWEFKWPDECALLDANPTVGVSHAAFDVLYTKFRTSFVRNDYETVQSGRGAWGHFLTICDCFQGT